MTELVFVKQGSKYVSEFEVTKDFNLHIERGKGGILYLQQRTTDVGMYDSVNNADFAPMDLIVDYDFSSLVYPKYIKVVSEVEPSYAAITTDGEVTEIKSQSKEVEITANGKVDVAPDAGYAYLSKVSVNVNVPQSGGESVEEELIYVSIPNPENLNASSLVQSKYIKLDIAGQMKVIASMADLFCIGDWNVKQAIAMAIQPSRPFFKVKTGDVEINNFDDFLAMTGVEALPWESLPRITEEEFYTL